jgi:hypothetical protein
MKRMVLQYQFVRKMRIKDSILVCELAEQTEYMCVHISFVPKRGKDGEIQLTSCCIEKAHKEYEL